MSPENRGSNRENINFAMQKNRTGVTPEGFKMPVPGKHDHDKKPVDHHVVRNIATVGAAVVVGLGVGVAYDQGMKNGWFDNFNGIFPPANTDTPTPGGQESPTQALQ